MLWFLQTAMIVPYVRGLRRFGFGLGMGQTRITVLLVVLIIAVVIAVLRNRR